MENLDAEEKKLVELLSKDFLRKIAYSRKSNIGVFQALKILSERLEIWELKLILLIAEFQPIKMEAILERLAGDVSKSTIYRKIPELIQQNIIVKNTDGLFALKSDLDALSTIANLYNILKREKND